jgi:hypothetical protein
LHTFDHVRARGFTLIRLMVGVGALTLIFSLVLHRRHERALHSKVGSGRDAVNLAAKGAEPGAVNLASSFAPSGAVTPCVVFVVPKFDDEPPEIDAPVEEAAEEGAVRPVVVVVGDY